MGTPVVTTDVGDASLYVKHGFNGYVVSASKLDDFASNVASFYKDPDKRRLFSERARVIAQTDLDLRICSDKQIQAYSSVCAS